ncbi:hypothetical protein [Actinomadura formosensis]|uniref:hypothetical protein n=1 Tax=Actinomadura formosensis TaxID=60706 RepID=UPI003D8BD992
MLTCQIFGHDFRFAAEGTTMRWWCARECGAAGSKEYSTASEARRYARVFDKKDTDDLGRRAPLVGLFPLRMIRAMQKRAGRTRAGR